MPLSTPVSVTADPELGESPTSALPQGGGPWPEAPRRGRPRLLRRLLHSPGGVVGLVLVLGLVAVALLADRIAPGNPMTLNQPPFQPPSARYPMGTDQNGRELFVAVIHAARTSLTVVFWSVTISAVIGLFVGTVAGLRGGVIDAALMRVTELFQAVPRFFLVLLMVGLGGGGLRNLIVLLGVTSWTGLARVVRAETLSLREREFVDAARSYGATDFRILRRHMLPHVLPAAVVLLTLLASRVILIEASLSFLGLGDQTRISWGFLASSAQTYMQGAWWLAVFPGAAIALAVLGFNLLGDGIADALRPDSLYRAPRAWGRWRRPRQRS